MKTRVEILDELLEINRQILPLQEQINYLCDEAEKIEDKEDDESEKVHRFSCLSSIMSYKTY
jgi:hypothetical protein